RKQQVVTNRGKPFSPSFFAFCVQFIRTFQHLYYVFTTFEWLASRVSARYATSQPELTGYSCFCRFRSTMALNGRSRGPGARATLRRAACTRRAWRVSHEGAQSSHLTSG